MSTKYPGGFITKSPVAPTTTAASGVWTLDQQQQYQKAGTWPAPPIFIEDIFSTYLYTGNGTSQSIVNGIDVSTYGGMTWIKNRSIDTGLSVVHDTARGTTQRLSTNLTDAQVNLTGGIGLTAFNTNGFTVGTGSAYNGSGNNLVSWTFRKQPKFFDVVTYTGNGTSGRTISHNLGSAPGFMIVKVTSTTDQWCIYHRSQGATKYGLFNTDAFDTYSGTWNNTEPTSTVFTVGNDAFVNANGATYVAYLFAHNAGGFPVSGGGSTNGISCGSYTGDGAANGQLINLGYEAQWVMIKQTNASGSGWWMTDIMRGWTVNGSSGGDANLYANASDAESSQVLGQPDAQGFRPINDNVNQSGQTYIYIAIRRGPMKTPTTGTSVFETVTSSASAGTVLTTGFPVDLQIQAFRSTTGAHRFMDRLRGVSTNSTAGSISLASTSTAVETTSGSYSLAWNNTGFQMTTAFESTSGVFWNFQRAPSFFDEVCYTGNGAARTITHNLSVAPELIIIKNRTNGGTLAPDWVARAVGLGNTSTLFLNLTDPAADYMSYMWNNANPTSTGFQLSVDNYMTNSSTGSTYVAWLFATCPGVSKVGSYTGTGALQTVNCGFSGGARFVLIKRSDDTGDWYTYDSARGLTSGNDPYLLLNSTAAEVTGTNYVDTDTTGFQVTAAAPAGLNANGGTYIFLAIA